MHPIAAYQIEYSPFSMDIEQSTTRLLSTCRELGIATVAYSPLGRGMLTGQYTSVDDFPKDDFRRSIPRFSQDNFPRNLELVGTLQNMAAGKACTVGQLVLAWMMAQGNDIFPIPGTKKIRYLEENWDANWVVITPEENKAIRTAIEEAEVHGTRVAERLMGVLLMDTPTKE